MRRGPVDFNYFLQQKYRQLQQQANAVTQNAATNALTGAAAANLDRVQADLLPDRSAAENARTRAQTGLINEQAAVVAPESVARIANMNADTGRIRTDTAVSRRYNLEELPVPSRDDLLYARSISGAAQGYRLPTFDWGRR